MEYQRAQLKQNVKRAMKVTRPRPIWITLLYMVVAGLGAWLIQTLLSGLNWTGSILAQYFALVSQGWSAEEATQALLAWLLRDAGGLLGMAILGSAVISFVVYLWRSLMLVGYEGYCLDMVRGRQPGVVTLFRAFPRAGGVLVTRILSGVFSFLWSLLFTLGMIVVMILGAGLATAVPFLGVILMLAGMVAYVVGLIWVTLRYSLADYALLDGTSGLEAIRTSKRLMKGNYRRLFVLELSFIGWYLIMFAVIFVGALILGGIVVGVGGAYVSAYGDLNLGGVMAMIGIVWVVFFIIMIAVLIISVWLTPYITGSIASFYDFLRSKQEHAPWVGGGNGGGQRDPWGRERQEQQDPWDYSSYSWSGQPGQSGQSGDAGQNWQPPQPPRNGEQSGDSKDTPPRGPNYPKY